jgi:uridine kinase
MTKKTENSGKPTRNNEIRMRYVKPEIFKELQQIAPLVRESTTPGIIVKLVANYRSDQGLIKQLQTRNNELHQAIAAYVERAEEMEGLIKQFILQTGKFTEMTVQRASAILKKFSGTKKRKKKPGAQRSQRGPGKRVPQKKGGKK